MRDDLKASELRAQERLKVAYDELSEARRVRRLETALMMIRDREAVENERDPQWAAQVARDALKEDV